MPKTVNLGNNMPADFTTCVKNGGKVITKDLGNGKYMHLCKDASGWHKGEIKQKQTPRQKLAKIFKGR